MASPVCNSSVGRKHTYSLQQALLLLLCVKAFPPVTGTVRREKGCVKYQSEKAGGWAAAQRYRETGPAVHLISPMGPLPGKAWLIRYTCATSCLSHCLAFCGAEQRDGGREGVCVRLSIMCMCGDSWKALLPFNDLPDLSVYSVHNTQVIL